MAVKQYKSHAQVPVKYTWDLEAILGSEKLDDLIDKLIKLYKKMIQIKDSKYKSPRAYLAALELGDQMSILYGRIHNYISNKISQNIVDHQMISRREKLTFQINQLSQQLGAEDDRFFSHSAKIREWIKKPAFADYRHSLSAKLEEEKHRLSREVEEFRTIECRADISASEVFSILTNSELEFAPAVSSKGQKITVNSANRQKLAQHHDAKVRKTAAISYRDAYLKHKGTLANLLYQHFKKISTWAKLERFDSSVAMLTFSDRVEPKMLTFLYEQVQKYLPVFKRARKYHQIFYRRKFGRQITDYDYEVALVKQQTNYTIEQTQKIVIESLKPFSSEYRQIAQKAILNERWVDYMPVQNKRTGAYSIGMSYGINKKYILMNFDGTLRSVETLAHELGHSMHSYFSDNSNSLSNASYPIFLAEIASIFNELMVLDHLLKNSHSAPEKFLIHQRIIYGFQATVLRQIEWSNYEFDLYQAIDEGKPLSTYEALAQLYHQNSLKYNLKEKKAVWS
ncbi:M3 family metallopeptidase [Mycoplasma sp. ATU-Cv-508]|uniref:M3 family metallopeptidase n=1 Tax=Mycoplasma sp. ATU-Cv-508 TaxID=2048001 RepID=UPI000FDEF749